MAYVPAKKIESVLKKVGILVEGYDVITNIDHDYMEEADRLGMVDGITDEFEFASEYAVGAEKLTFYGKMCEDYRQVSPTQELPYYYPYIEACKIVKENGETKTIGIDVYWK